MRIENSIKTKATPKTTLAIMLLELFLLSLEATKLSFIGVVRALFAVPLKFSSALEANYNFYTPGKFLRP